QLFRLFSDSGVLWLSLVALALLLVGLAVWRWCSRAGVYKFSAQHVLGLLLGLIEIAVSIAAFLKVASMSETQRVLSQAITFVAPIQQTGNALTVEVGNVEDKGSFWRGAFQAWPALLAI